MNRLRQFIERLRAGFFTLIVGILSLCTIIYSLTNLKKPKTIKRRRDIERLKKDIISITIGVISLGLIIYTVMVSGL